VGSNHKLSEQVVQRCIPAPHDGSRVLVFKVKHDLHLGKDTIVTVWISSVSTGAYLQSTI
jgi:hypothetical protein